EARQRGTAEVLPEVGRTAEGDEPAEVIDGADAAEVVGLAEEGAAGLVHESSQQALLNALRGAGVETAQAAAGGTAGQGGRQPSRKARLAQLIQQAVTVHPSDPSGVRVQKQVAC